MPGDAGEILFLTAGILAEERESTGGRRSQFLMAAFRWASLQDPGYMEAIFVDKLLSAPVGQAQLGLLGA